MECPNVSPPRQALANVLGEDSQVVGHQLWGTSALRDVNFFDVLLDTLDPLCTEKI
ncbi:hypothetical protein GFS31_25200 [Leptolyngbya sp. BL0902]|nr:hypothetical protein GFS31_25200 [Leptolyngbya sp. BL0902]